MTTMYTDEYHMIIERHEENIGDMKRNYSILTQYLFRLSDTIKLAVFYLYDVNSREKYGAAVLSVKY
jgi:hypothetical protein